MVRILVSLFALWACVCRGQGAGPAPPALSYDALYTVDSFDVRRGSAHGTAVLDRAELVVDYDGTSSGRAWLTARLDLGHMNGHSVGSLAGDVQGISNIEGPEAFRLFNLWMAGTRGPWSAKVGVIDLNSEFDTQDVAALFVGGSHGTGPDLSHTGRNGPSVFPNMGPGAIGSYTSASNVILKLGLFDGTPNDPDHPRANRLHLSSDDGALLIGSIERRFLVDTRLAAGVWSYSSRFPKQTNGTPGPHWASRGAYAIVETPLVRGSGQEPRAEGWLRVGAGNAPYDPVRSYLGSGLVYRGLSRQDHPRDSLGIAVARAGLARGAYRAAVDGSDPPRSHETTWELTYRRRLGSLITLQPDLQYVMRPSGRAGHALAVGFRLSIEKGNQPVS